MSLIPLLAELEYKFFKKRRDFLKVTLLTHTPDPERVVAAAANLCYSQKVDVETLMSSLTSDQVNKLLTLLQDSGHETPFEHATFTFAIEGVSRAFLAQESRHRLQSLNVRSQRYCSESNFETVMPPAVEANDEARIAYRSVMADIKNAYTKMQELGIKNEDARSVLPNSCETRMIVTMNTRALWHFFNERMCSHAQHEIKLVATEMLRLCKEAAPLLFKNAGPKCVKGYCPEGKRGCGKAPTMEKLQEAYKLMKFDAAMAKKAAK